jgi:hypothetical protein
MPAPYEEDVAWQKAERQYEAGEMSPEQVSALVQKGKAHYFEGHLDAVYPRRARVTGDIMAILESHRRECTDPECEEVCMTPWDEWLKLLARLSDDELRMTLYDLEELLGDDERPDAPELENSIVRSVDGKYLRDADVQPLPQRASGRARASRAAWARAGARVAAAGRVQLHRVQAPPGGAGVRLLPRCRARPGGFAPAPLHAARAASARALTRAAAQQLASGERNRRWAREGRALVVPDDYASVREAVERGWSETFFDDEWAVPP